MTTFTNVFGGALIYPSELIYRAVSLTDDLETQWPIETGAPAAAILARIMDITPDATGHVVLMPDATIGANGNTTLFNNRGSDTFTVSKSTGVPICTVAPGEAWQVYLTDNTTAAGTWQAFQFASFLSQANAAALAGQGLASSANQLVPNMPVNQFNGNIALDSSSRANVYEWTGTSGDLDLPDPVTVGNGWFVYLKNNGTGGVTVTPGGSAEIDGEADKFYNVGDASAIVSDGTNFFTIGFGQDAVFAFDNVSIDVAGTGDYTLTGNELNRISYNFTGLLTGNRNIIVPATIQQYWVANNTTGSFSLTVKTAAQPGTGVTQGGAAILYSNGIDVIQADTGGLSTPIAVADGGTGASTASAARTNLGSGATGDAIFVAATPAAAWAALGAAPAGVVDGGTF